MGFTLLFLTVFLACVAAADASGEVQAPLDVVVAGDATGRLLGTVSYDEGKKAAAQANVTVSGTGPLGAWQREAQTDAHGFFVVTMPLCPSNQIHVGAEWEGRSGQTTVGAESLSLRLSPRPDSDSIDLDGDWHFLPDPPERVATDPDGLDWHPISVPSHYEMAGYRTETDTAAYRKTFTIPTSWAGKRIRLRPEAIYSFCKVWLNGQLIGTHEGGATPFELDASSAARPGETNDLCIFVRARSKASVFDHMSTYAFFEIAGIWRPISLFCLPPSHVSRLVYSVDFDSSYKNARLSMNVRLANEQDRPTAGRLAIHVTDPEGTDLRLSGLDTSVTIPPWEEQSVTLAVNVVEPQQWNAELPRNYRIYAVWTADGQVSKIQQPLGFRQVQIQGRSFSINGKPVRLFGTCLHDADPFMGRAITAERARQDLELVKEANFNSIRTTHYPPHPATPAFADQIGLYIEDEAPSCWGDENQDLRNAPMYIGIVSEYMERDRNHPSVVYWSTCNESDYGVVFELAARWAKQLDPSRPVGGSYAPLEADNDVYVLHYPLTLYEYIDEAKDFPKPVFYDESIAIPHGWGDLAHSEEIDPGMHCLWEWKLPEIRRKMMENENQMGVMSWAWVDDAFAVPGRGIVNTRLRMPPILYANAIYKMPGRGYVGDTVWGMIDGWRRPRPEWWQAKKVFSPIVIQESVLHAPPADESILVEVTNLNWFANLNSYKCEWQIGGAHGTATANVPPSSNGTVSIDYRRTVVPGDVLSLKWLDETGRLVDAYNLTFRAHPVTPWSMGAPASITVESGRYLSGAKAVYLRGDKAELAYDQTSGGLLWGLHNRELILSHGPTLHILKSDRPTSVDPPDWKFATESHGEGTLQWNGAFGEEFSGGYTIRMDQADRVEVSYRFAYRGPETYVRELGLKFELLMEFDRLSWDRKAEHSAYPEDHLDRPVGSVMAHPGVSQSVPPQGRPWALDDHPWGCNDFRSTKRNIYGAELRNANGQGLKIVSDGTQHVRASVGVHGVTIRVLDYYGGFGPPHSWSTEGFHYGSGKLLKPDDVVSGTVRLEFLGDQLFRG